MLHVSNVSTPGDFPSQRKTSAAPEGSLTSRLGPLPSASAPGYKPEAHETSTTHAFQPRVLTHRRVSHVWRLSRHGCFAARVYGLVIEIPDACLYSPARKRWVRWQKHRPEPASAGGSLSAVAKLQASCSLLPNLSQDLALLRTGTCFQPENICRP